MYSSPLGEIYWARLITDEVLVSFLFAMIYLIVRFESSMRKIDRIVRGIAVSFALFACIALANGSGAVLNPALGFSLSIYMIGIAGQNGLDTNTAAQYMWIYMLFPYAGAAFAALFYKLHEHIDRNEYKQNKPMQFVGLMVHSNENSQVIQTNLHGQGHQYMMTNSQIHVP
jgi:glycerol uptake facilitator-like aquaporin